MSFLRVARTTYTEVGLAGQARLCCSALGLAPRRAEGRAEGLLREREIFFFFRLLVLGRSLGYVSSAFYLGSRISQIVKNRARSLDYDKVQRYAHAMQTDQEICAALDAKIELHAPRGN